MKVRVAKKTEPYIKRTMVSLQNKGIILKDREKFRNQPIETIIEEILTHEIIHIVIFKLQNEIVSCVMDKIVAWTRTCDGLRLAFYNKKTNKIIFQTPD